MKHNDHVDLLRPAHLPAGGAWADFGAGSGAFTLALRELIGPDAEIYAVDKDRGRLSELERNYHVHFGNTSRLHILAADFSRDLKLPQLDGILMANSLHFFRDKESVLHHVSSFLKPGGALLLVEYNIDSGNLWVPHPLSFESWQKLAIRAGFGEPQLLATRPSSFLKGFYSAISTFSHEFHELCAKQEHVTQTFWTRNSRKSLSTRKKLIFFCVFRVFRVLIASALAQLALD